MRDRGRLPDFEACEWHRVQRAFALTLLAALVSCAGALDPASEAAAHEASVPCTPHRATITGHVTDPSGAAVAHAHVLVTAGAAAPVAETWTSEDGAFTLCGLPSAELTLSVRSEGFSAWQRSVRPSLGAVTDVAAVLSLAPRAESVTVTPVRGDARPVSWTPELVLTEDAIHAASNPGDLLPARFRHELGLHVQQTSAHQASPYVRGLTGQQVVALVDGIRFNNATFRPGANQYTALLDPAYADRVEVVHGPNGAQYGSDALGGTINVLTRGAGGWTGPGPSTEVVLAASSADLGAAASFASGFATRRTNAFVEASARSCGDLRTGEAVDSHSAVTRLFELPSSVLGNRLHQTGYRQFGASAKAVTQLSADQVLSVSYLHDAQGGASRYDMLDGGAGNLLHRFDPQTVDFGYIRFDRVGLGPMATVQATASVNSQRDEREYQNINNNGLGLASDISTEHNRTTAVGFQIVATAEPRARQAIRTGVEHYGELVDSTRHDAKLDEATGAIANVTSSRARYPDGARYSTLGAFVQDVVSVVPDRMQVLVGARYSRFSYSQRASDSPSGVDGPLVPDFSTVFDDLTGSVGAVVALASHWHLTGNVARGFRAPNVNDFGTIGLSGGGFEISPEEARRVSGSVRPAGSSAAVPVGELEPETLWSYDVGLRASSTRISASVSAYQADIANMIERRIVLLPPGAVGTTIGGQPIIRQDASGAVYTPVSSSSVFVRVNGTRVRLRGFDAALSGQCRHQIDWRTTAGYVRGTDLADGKPPRIENGLPPLHGSVALRWTTLGGRAWLQAGAVWAATQNRLSDNDLRQARIGATRTREEIRDFFNNGAVARGLVSNGILLATGETLAQVTTRVLGTNASLPLYTDNPGFCAVTVGTGWRFATRARLLLMVENVLDANYRHMGSGVDGPGVNVIVRQTWQF
jgi:outer membrane receptor protein involved in Fe transport